MSCQRGVCGICRRLAFRVLTWRSLLASCGPALNGVSIEPLGAQVSAHLTCQPHGGSHMAALWMAWLLGAQLILFELDIAGFQALRLACRCWRMPWDVENQLSYL